MRHHALTAELAFVGFVIGMDHHVCLECLRLGEGLVTAVTLVRALSFMYQHVTLHVGTLVERPSTDWAAEWSEASVCELVSSKVMFLNSDRQAEVHHFLTPRISQNAQDERDVILHV